MKIGFSSLDITPTAGTPLSGQPFVVRSAGIMDPLSVRAVCLDDGTTAVIVLSCDVLLMTGGVSMGDFD